MKINRKFLPDLFGKEMQKLYLIMKLTWFFTFVLTINASASLWSQTTKMNVKATNSTLQELFRQIEENSDYRFFYNNDDVDVSEKVVVDLQDKNIGEILTETFANMPYSFKEVNNNLILIEKVDNSGDAAMQQAAVSGKVTDENGQPLPGVTIVIQGTTTGTVTDVDGNYKIGALPENAVLVFSFVGMATQEIPTAGQSVINVTLAIDAIGLDEIIAIGYGSIRKSDLTGAVSKVSGSELVKMPTSSVSQALQGRVSGVRVINSQDPGGGSTIRIRGIATMNNAEPLYVIDGFPTGGMNHLTSNEIESIEILKDASATAIYGSRGANGVVLITTKSGSFEKKTTVSVNAYVGREKEIGRYDMLNATEYATLFYEALDNNGQSPSTTLGNQMDYILANNYKGTDWQDEFIRPGFNQNYNISISGGTKNSAYDVGATYAHETGIVKKGFSEKIFLHANNDYKINDKIQVGTKLNYHTSLANYKNPFVGIKKEPMVPAWDDYTGNYGTEAVWDNQNQARVLDHDSKYFLNSPHRQFRAKAYLQMDDLLIKGLSFRSQFGVSLGYRHKKKYNPVFRVGGYYRDESSLEEERKEDKSWTWTNYLTYKKSIDKHKINLTIGTEAQKWEYSDMGTTVFSVPNYYTLYYINSSTNKEMIDVSGGGKHNSLLSYFSRANYNFDNRFLLTATMRADASSKFTDDYAWGYFPSFSAGYNIMEEPFMEGLSGALSALKIRGGWGQVGNQSSAGNNDYAGLVYGGYLTTMGADQTIVDGAVQLNVPNPDIHWEIAEQSNIGLNFVTANNRFNGSVDLFKRDTKDMIISKPIPIYAGQERPKVNAASMSNKGVEIELGYNGSSASGLQYGVSLNVSYIKNEVFDVPEPIMTDERTYTENGEPMAYFFGYQTNGIIKTQSELDAYLAEVTNRTTGLGDVRFIDQITVDTDDDGIPDAKDGQINGDDRVKIGNPWPALVGGLNIDLAYKGFDFTLFCNGEYDKDVWNSQAQNFSKTKMTGGNLLASRMDRWTPENPNSDQPRMHNADPNKNSEADDRYIEDASFFRLTSAQVGYTLPKSTTEKIGLSYLRLYLTCDNIYTFTKYSGLNPEIDFEKDDNGKVRSLLPGFDGGTYPLLRTFTIGANIKF